jgi:hypothetical protein
MEREKAALNDEKDVLCMGHLVIQTTCSINKSA